MSDDLIDARGLLCPLPVLRLRKRMSKLASGEQIILWADDPAAAIDVPHFCAESGHVLVETGTLEDGQTYTIKKK